MAKPFLYRCPVTGMNVQGVTTDNEGGDADGSEGRRERELVRCLACGGVHLVDPSKGPKPPAKQQ